MRIAIKNPLIRNFTFFAFDPVTDDWTAGHPDTICHYCRLAHCKVTFTLLPGGLENTQGAPSSSQTPPSGGENWADRRSYSFPQSTHNVPPEFVDNDKYGSGRSNFLVPARSRTTIDSLG